MSEFIPPETKKVEIIPEDLKSQWGAAQACSITLALFDQASFPARIAHHVAPSAAFLTKLHEQTVDQALAHPQAHMIPELKAEMKKRKGAKNGETKTDTEG